ncbi:lytic transglycosylase domain-containing protein [Acetivibrio cellulolyticus]|uniref:lytic transglycosylase domain-containing protein n=1 Tax=Acetivibrio cellulolyticus TaxID=35830 RepID=UPI0001E2D519|nr:lytic transglycosylase domain-containing protein [Acetivibrio cellulolyticus]
MRKIRRSLKVLIVLIIALVAIVYVLNSVGKKIFPLEYKGYVIKYSEEYELDPLLVFSVIKAESNFNPRATSRKNARGLMQIMDNTGIWAAEQIGIEEFQVESLYDPEVNIRIGCWYLKKLRNELYKYNGEINNDLILAAYNGGIGNVQKWLKDSQYSSSGKTLDRIPYKETEHYVKKVNNYQRIYKKLYEKEI